MNIIPRRFRGAGTTGHVFVIPASGKEIKDLGVGASPLIYPWSGDKVAVVPTGVESLVIEQDVLTESNLVVRVGVDLSIKLDPVTALRNFDFSEDAETDWRQELQPMLKSWIIEPIREIAQGSKIEEIIVRQKALIEKIESILRVKLEEAKLGVSVIVVEVSKIVPIDASIAKALGAEAREALLQAEGSAVHTRQMQAQQEATALENLRIEDAKSIAASRVEQITAENANRLSIAQGEAEAETKRLEPYAKTDKGVLLALAFKAMAEKGVGRLDITSDLLASLGAKISDRG